MSDSAYFLDSGGLSTELFENKRIPSLEKIYCLLVSFLFFRKDILLFACFSFVTFNLFIPAFIHSDCVEDQLLENGPFFPWSNNFGRTDHHLPCHATTNFVDLI